MNILINDKIIEWPISICTLQAFIYKIPNIHLSAEVHTD